MRELQIEHGFPVTAGKENLWHIPGSMIHSPQFQQSDEEEKNGSLAYANGPKIPSKRN
jgi:hypothetical protein